MQPMLRAVLLLSLAACHRSAPPPPPDPTAFAKLSAADKCEAITPRAAMCASEMMLADVRSLGSGFTEIDQALTADDSSMSTREAEDVARVACLGTPGTGDAVVACWAIEDCTQFAACLQAQRK